MILIDLSQFNLCIDFLLLHLSLKLLLALLGLVNRDLLLQSTVLHLLILKHNRLNLTIELLEYQFVLLDHQLQVLLILDIGGVLLV